MLPVVTAWPVTQRALADRRLPEAVTSSLARPPRDGRWRMKVIVGLALVALGSGCSLVRQHLVATAVGNHVYGQRLDELWPSAGKMLSDLGYSYTESAGAGGTRVLLSDWKGAFETSEMAATWTRVA